LNDFVSITDSCSTLKSCPNCTIANKTIFYNDSFSVYDNDLGLSFEDFAINLNSSNKTASWSSYNDNVHYNVI